MSLVNSVMSSVVNVNDEVKDHHWNNALSSLLAMLVLIVLNGLLGEYLWNNFAKRLVPALGKARWQDTVMLQVLLYLLLPQ